MHTRRDAAHHMMRRPARPMLVLCLSASLVTSACTGRGGEQAASRTAGGPRSGSPASLIEQPAVTGLQVAPASRRVDLRQPTFSEPRKVTNPLFPVAQQASVLLLGQVDGKQFRTEVTLLPETRVVQWRGQQVETLVSQYVAFLDGRLQEVAYDLYAQDDNGAVWYFGEDVFNFRDGFIADTHGTWLAGRDGPAAMIMPAEPKVGDVYRPENIPGFVFEEVTVKSVDQRLQEPVGPVDGGLVIEELHMDGSTEGKSFAPGYGEFYTAGGGDVEALALAVPTDAVSGPVPPALTTLTDGAEDTSRAARSQRWAAALVMVRNLQAAWDAYAAAEAPRLIAPRMRASLRSLNSAIGARDLAQVNQAAFDIAQSSLDLQLRHRPVADIDVARFRLWLDRLAVDARGGDAAAVNGDLFTLDYLRDRILQSLDDSVEVRINTGLERLQGALDDEDLRAAGKVATALRQALPGTTTRTQ